MPSLTDRSNTGRHPAGSGWLRALLRKSFAGVGVRLIDIPSRYGFHLSIAAALGVDEAGRFYIVFSMMTALAIFGRLGIDRALTRQISFALASGNAAAVRKTIRRGFALVFAASLAVSLLLVAAATPYAIWVLHRPDLAELLMLGALVFIPQNLSVAAAGVLAGLQRIGFSQMIYSWFCPGLFCLVALVSGLSVRGALLLFAACFAVTACVGMALAGMFLRQVPRDEGMPAAEAPPPLPIMKLGLSLFTLELTQLLIGTAPTIILGMVASNQEVGLFALAGRGALLINVLITGVASMAVPRFAALHSRGDHEELARLLVQTLGLSLGLSLIPALVMLAVPGPLLGLFGPGYDLGSATLRILTLGQLGAACFTALPDLLGMTAYTRSLRRINAMALVVLLAGTSLLATLWGAEGAALATAMVLALHGATAAWFVRRHLGLRPLRTLWGLILGGRA